MRLPNLIVLAAITLWFAGAAEAGAQESPSWIIQPVVSAGPITASSSEADLILIYGRENVVDGRVYVGEGAYQHGTVVFPTDSTRRIEITWKDEDRRNPERIRIAGHSSRWETVEGITLGTTLRQLEQINGRAFQLCGAERDCGGLVNSWNGGELRHYRTHTGRLLVTLRPTGPVAGFEVSSERPEMQDLNPVVVEILLWFDEFDTILR